MSRIFISHSSRDNAAALALNGWLRENGWDDVFLDLDPERGIKAGERWERSLYEAANRCQAVIFLVSRSWLDSNWCGKEFDLAAKLNKRMFGVLIDDIAIKDIPPRFTDTWQFTNLAVGQDHDIFRAVVPPDDREAHVTFSRKGLRRLNAGLQAAGLDPSFFEWPPRDDPNRPPYTGLPPMAEADAGIFFGREADIVRALDELRGLVRKAPPRIFVIEGASGCGKSSFLRAGLIPRLRRDDRAYLVLPPIRPEQAAIDGAWGLVSALEIAFADAGLPRNRADCRMLAASPEELGAALADLAWRHTVSSIPGEAEAAPPAIVIAVDQAEELFRSSGRDQGRRLLDLLATLALSRTIRLLLVFTIRTDDYEPLQTAAALESMPQHIFGLAPIPIGRLGTIIEGPARRMTESGRTLTLEPALVTRLLKDLQEGSAADVMPLCAFILERLWREYGGDGRLTLTDYESAEHGIGGIRGALEGAVTAAFAQPESEPAIPADPTLRDALLRRAMIPALAAIDPETRTPRRRVARLSEIPAEARPLVERLVQARLISSDLDPETRERSLEPAHEALLRQWSLMETWLDEDARHLLVLEGVERAASDWAENDRAEKWLAHAGGRLEDAERLRGRRHWADRLTGAPGDYLDACHAAETARRDKELADARRIAAEQEARAAAESARAEEEKARAAADRRARDRTRIGFAVAVVLLIAAAITAFSAWNSSNRLAAANADLARTNEDLDRANDEVRAQRDQASEQARIAQAALIAREEAQDARAREQLGFVWQDLGTREEEVRRLTMVASDLNIDPDVVVPKVARDENELFSSCDTWLWSGFRHLYCSTRDIVSFEKIQVISGLSVFREGGPHDHGIDLRNDYAFGHYNPEFLDWLDQYLIPPDQNDPRFNRLTRLAYESHIGPLARALYHSHQVLMETRTNFAAVERRYAEAARAYNLRTDTTVARFDGAIEAFNDVRDIYFAELESGQVSQWRQEGRYMGERFRWLADYLATVEGDDWYLVNTAGGFWVRRSIDGTHEQIFNLVIKLLQTFEPDILQDHGVR